MVNLGVLPNEILSLVTNHLQHPRDVLHLSLANKRLYEFAQLDGWKEFLKGRFGIPVRDSDARTAVHGITTLCRNWDRKAFVARDLRPSNKTTSLNTWERESWNVLSGQTMGYRPNIDSYEESEGSWTDRKEVVAWSAGSKFVLRLKETGSKAAKAWNEEHEDDAFDSFRHLNSWYTYQIPEGREGRDDITALKLLRPHQKDDASECLAFGSASGDLCSLRLNPEEKETKTQTYNTWKQPHVSSVSIAPNNIPLMAATLGESLLALYPINHDYPEGEGQQAIDPVASVAIVGTRVHSCNFISNDTIALGVGPAYEPVQVFGITPTGLSLAPLHSFNFDTEFRGGFNKNAHSSLTTVYPIVPVSPGSQAGSEAGHVFLSGGFDGIIRLHDLRSPHNSEAMYWDVTNDGTIYSLATQGLERVVAGTSMHGMLKVFDLRLSGSHAYHSIPLSPQRRYRKSNATTVDHAENLVVHEAIKQTTRPVVTGGWNVFLRQQIRSARSRADSPVYSLSIPSATSPSLYAGLEGAVIGMDFISVTDKHPDPFFAQTIEHFPDSQTIDIKASYNPFDDVLNLGMYEQGTEQALLMNLMMQENVSNEVGQAAERRDRVVFQHLDERWKDPSGDRWVRGQEPTGRVDQAPSRGGGRGRGRGQGRGRGRATGRGRGQWSIV